MMKKEIGLSFAAQVFGLGMLFLANIFLARHLGPGGRGLFALAVFWPRMLGVLVDFGQTSANPTFAGLYPDKRKSLFAQTFYLTGAFGALAMAALAAYFFWLPVEKGRFAEVPGEVVVVALLLVLIEPLSRAVQELARGTQRIIVTALITAGGWALLAAAYFVVLGPLGGGLRAVVLATLAVNAVMLLCQVVQIRQYATLDPRRLSRPLVWETLSFGGMVTLTTVGQTGIVQSGVLLLGYLGRTPEEIGLYAVAMMFAAQLVLIPDAVGRVYLPRLSNSPQALAAMAPLLFRVTLLVDLLSVAALAVVGPVLLPLLFGRDFVGSIVPFLIVAFGLAVQGASRIPGVYLLVRKKPRALTAATWVGSAVVVVVSLATIPVLGIVGAALGNCLAQLVSSVLVCLVYRRESGVRLTELVPRKSDLVFLAVNAKQAVRAAMARAGLVRSPVPPQGPPPAQGDLPSVQAGEADAAPNPNVQSLPTDSDRILG